MPKFVRIQILMIFCLLMISTVSMAGDLYVTTEDYYYETSLENVPNLAEISLGQLADRDRNSRYVAGGTLLAIGGGIGVVGAVLEEGEVTVLGGVMAGIGGAFLLFPSKAEKELIKVQEVANLEEREYLAYESLSYLADLGFRDRIIIGISNAALGGYYLIERPSRKSGDLIFGESYDIEMGLSCVGTALYYFMVPSYEEKLFEKVQLQKRQSSWSFNFGEITGLKYTYQF